MRLGSLRLRKAGPGAWSIGSGGRGPRRQLNQQRMWNSKRNGKYGNDAVKGFHRSVQGVSRIRTVCSYQFVPGTEMSAVVNLPVCVMHACT